MNSKPFNPSSAWRMSLRELLTIVALLAAGCVALKYASPDIALITNGLLLIIGGATVIYALVARGAGQAFAIGFIAIALGHVGSLYFYDIRYGVIPSEKLLTLLHGQIATKWVVEPNTYERIRPYHPSQESTVQVIDLNSSVPSVPDRYAPPVSPGPPVLNAPAAVLYISNYPSIMDFLAVGNALCVLLFSYVGGKFAVWVYLKRLAREQGEKR